jgi:methyl-accepting chemotaxis protein
MADAQKVAAGDFSFIDESSGEKEQNTQNELELLKQAFKAMVSNLRDLTLKIKEAALSVADSSKQIANSAEQSAKTVEQIALTINELADGASRQAQLSQDGSEMVSQTISQLGNILNDIELLETSTGEAISSVQVGLQKVMDQKQKMKESKDRTVSLEKTILELGTQSRRIGEIVDVIVGIAGQTDLLALNAAIEAARAGESGKGFAVVAGEVRKLAEESSNATEEIKGIIGQIQDGINKANEEMEKTVKNVEDEEIAVESTSEAFEQIQAAIENASQKTKKVAEAALELSENAQELKKEIEQINSIAQDNAAATEEVAAATEEQTASSEEISGEAAELAKLAQKLEEEVSNFKY